MCDWKQYHRSCKACLSLWGRRKRRKERRINSTAFLGKMWFSVSFLVHNLLRRSRRECFCLFLHLGGDEINQDLLLGSSLWCLSIGTCVSSIRISRQRGHRKQRGDCCPAGHRSAPRNPVCFRTNAQFIRMSPFVPKMILYKKKKSKNVSAVLCLLLDLPFLINKCILVPYHISLQPNTALQIAS